MSSNAFNDLQRAEVRREEQAEIARDERERMARHESDKYQELLYAVGRKYPGETRHETALRYIRQAEAAGTVNEGGAKEAKP